MNPIILTGLMGSGKTTVGQVLAKDLGQSFLDADTFFAEKTGLSPTFYIRRFGIRAFRRLESHCLRAVFRNPPGVLASGGGIVLKSENRRLILSKGFVVWLHIPLFTILIRLNRRVLRPMIPRPISLYQLECLFEKRKPFYQQCHLKIFDPFAIPKEVAIRIVEQYRNHVSRIPCRETGHTLF